jgi:hypothetical protein
MSTKTRTMTRHEQEALAVFMVGTPTVITDRVLRARLNNHRWGRHRERALYAPDCPACWYLIQHYGKGA